MAAEDAAATASPIGDDISPNSSPRPAPAPAPAPASAPAAEEEQDANAKKVEEREAMEYWGFMVKSDKCGSDKLNRLLEGIAQYISRHFEGPKDCNDLTPAQLAAFYRAVGGNYDVLFIESHASSIAFIYKALGCLHSIQPADDADGHAAPTLPSLKPRGFVTWQTIQLLLGPEEHVPFLQTAVEQFDIVDPATGQVFPKVLPKEAFPEHPNKEMLDWYDQVQDKLRQDLQACGMGDQSLSLSDASASEQSGDEKNVASYRNPMFRDSAGRPTMARGNSKGPHASKTPRQIFQDRGRQVMHSVRHFMNPTTTHHSNTSNHHNPPAPKYGRRSSLPDRYKDDDEDRDIDYEDPTPTGLHPQYKSKPPRPRNRSPEIVEPDTDSDHFEVRKRPPVGRRTSSSNSKSHSREHRERRERQWERESPRLSTKGESPTLRHRRSHEPAVSPRDYFPPHVFENEGPRRHSHNHGSYANSEPSPSFAPSTEPSFASRVSKIPNPRTSSPRRPAFDDRDRGGGGSGGGYTRSGPPEDRGNFHGRPTVRYSRRNVDPYNTDGSRPRFERKKRSDDYLDDAPPPRPSPPDHHHYANSPDAGAGYRKRSHSYERDNDRVRNSTRYVEGAQGRRYPEPSWR